MVQSYFSAVFWWKFCCAGDGIMCHRCYSAFGGCSDHVVWRMYPWRECGSEFCVKVIEKIPGES